MKDNWHDGSFSANWDDTSNVGNPTRQQQIEILTGIVANVYKPETKVLDLGFGSGQVEKLLFESIAGLEVIGVDSSQEMIKIAASRLENYTQRYSVVEHDLSEIMSLRLDHERISVVLSVQALHELTHEQKRQVFSFVHTNLEPGGYYLVVDRFTVPEELEQAYQPIWNYLEERATTKSGQSFSEYSKKMQNKEDFTASPEEHIKWLQKAGFTASCLYLNINRGLIVARK